MAVRTRLVATVAAGASLALAAGVTVAAGGPAVGAASKTLAYWQMNEKAGAKVMLDSSGNGLNGTIGSLVKTGVKYAGATGYSWSYTPPNTPPAQPQRLVRVESSKLNPGKRDYAVTIRYRTTRSFGNILQKGQNTVAGGYFKIELPNGLPTCLFKDGTGRQRAIKSTLSVKDGAWHTIRCERTQAGVTLTIDNSYKRSIKGPTGSISNSWPLTIGGKPSCNQVKVTCDYFVGDIDWVRIESS